MDFLDILERHERVFSDTGFLDVTENIYRDFFYDLRTYDDVDKKKYQEILDLIQLKIEWYQQPNVVSVDGVVEEHSRFANLMSEKLRFLNQKRYSDKTKRELLDHIVRLQHCVVKRSRHSTYHSRNTSECLTLVKFVIERAEQEQAKEKPFYRKATRFEDTHADEQLVGCALHSALYENTPCAIATSDTDIYYIFKALRDADPFRNLNIDIASLPITIYLRKPSGNIEVIESLEREKVHYDDLQYA
ncbi:hypothetical protein D6774_04490 [Candidatus Woesearchaeota archaeon]|nr:MAG: hypothetical protein D6774_04490 [Candidatus Woesearchaeota archaeon]